MFMWTNTLPPEDRSTKVFVCGRTLYHARLVCSNTHRVLAVWTRGPTRATPQLTDGDRPQTLRALLKELKKGKSRRRMLLIARYGYVGPNYLRSYLADGSSFTLHPRS